MAKRTLEEQVEFNSVLRVQTRKNKMSLADVTAQLAIRNLEMAADLKARGVQLPEYYAHVRPKRREDR